jgi:3D (Asp-Asp-Asp) domain-containing protein
MFVRKMGVLVLAALFLGGILAVAQAEAAEVKAWRVEGKLIRIGDSKAEVLAVAGEPDNKENLRKAVDIGDKKKGDRVDVWYYRNKPKSKIHIIHFRNSNVSKIQWERY